MDRFVHEVVKTKLDNLSSADRVKYAILQGHEWNGIWLRASVDSEELKGTISSNVYHCAVSYSSPVLCRNWLVV